jgi:hypothetical protein
MVMWVVIREIAKSFLIWRCGGYFGNFVISESFFGLFCWCKADVIEDGRLIKLLEEKLCTLLKIKKSLRVE